MLAALLVVAGYASGLAASASAQCCDAVRYIEEGERLVSQGIWPSNAHNYAYPLWLAVLDLVGLSGRTAVAVAQLTLLYLAAAALAFVIARVTGSPMSRAFAPIALVALLPATAWSGYTLSEGLAAPLILTVLALSIGVVDRLLTRPRAWATTAFVALLGLACGVAWMTRPALVWLPVAIGLVLLLLCGRIGLKSWRGALALPLLFAFVVGVVAMPEALNSKLFPSRLIQNQAAWGSVMWRYSTNLSGCGPVPLVFSPVTDERVDPTLDRPVTAGIEAPQGIGWRVVTAGAHLVSGWDPRPSPTYAETLDDPRWLFVASVSGFVIVAFLIAAGIVWRRRTRIWAPRVAVINLLLGLFAASQLMLAPTAAEFRFNLPGWLIGAACLAMIAAIGWWTRRRAFLAVAGAVGISLVIVVAGQYTLDQSADFLACLA